MFRVMNYVATTMVILLPALHGQQPDNAVKPLSEADVVGLITRQSDDRAIIGRIAKHKLAFPMDEAALARLKQANPSPEVLAALAAFLPQRDAQPNAEPKGSWEKLDSGVKDRLRAVTFLDDKVGIVVGDNRTILKTVDAGKTWKRVTKRADGGHLEAVVFSTPKLGWAIEADSGLILHTTDGGDTWKEMPCPDLGFGGKVVTHAAVGSTYFYMTWGFVTPGIFQTTDAGKTWVTLKNDLPLSGYGRSARMVFVDAKQGHFVTTTNGGKLGRTLDGGKTWAFQKTEQTPNQDRAYITFVDKNHGWYCLLDGDVYATTDAGQTWTRCNRKFGGSLGDLHFVDVKVGHVWRNGEIKTPGAQGEVMRTTDGGKTWTGLGELVTPYAVYGICFPSANHGWVVGYEGYIARYQAK